MRKRWRIITPVKRNRWPWGIVFLYCLLIFKNSLQPAAASEKTSLTALGHILPFLKYIGLSVRDPHLFHFYMRKLAHVTEFAGLGFLVWAASSFKSLTRYRRRDCLLFFFLIPCLDETIQLFIPGRTGAFSDVLIDGAGFLFGVFLTAFLFFLTRSLYALCYDGARK